VRLSVDFCSSFRVRAIADGQMLTQMCPDTIQSTRGAIGEYQNKNDLAPNLFYVGSRFPHFTFPHHHYDLERVTVFPRGGWILCSSLVPSQGATNRYSHEPTCCATLTATEKLILYGITVGHRPMASLKTQTEISFRRLLDNTFRSIYCRLYADLSI